VSTQYKSEENTEIEDVKTPIYGAIHRFANRPHGVTSALLLTVIFGFLGILGSYNMLPCQSDWVGGKECKKAVPSGGQLAADTTKQNSTSISIQAPDHIEPTGKPNVPEKGRNVVERSDRQSPPSPQGPPPDSIAGPIPTALFPSLVPRSAVPAPPPSKPEAPEKNKDASGQHKLDATTRSRVPIVVVKHSKFDADYDLSIAVARNLENSGFVVVYDESQAALRVEISNVRVYASLDLTGKAFENSKNSQWNGHASAVIQAIWIDGKDSLFQSEFSGDRPGGSEELAELAARNDVREQIVKKFITFVRG
jgi:hypothetical protein